MRRPAPASRSTGPCSSRPGRSGPWTVKVPSRPVTARSAKPGRPARRGAAAPVRPVAAAAELRGDRPVDAGRPATKPSPGPRTAQADVEPVLLGHGVEHAARAGRRRRSPARAIVPAIEADLGAAVGDPDPAVERQQMAPPGHRRIDQQPADAQSADVDVDVGQQRRVRDRRREARAAGAAAPRGCPASGCRYGCGDRRRAGSRARRVGARKKTPWGSLSETSCRVSSPKTEPSIRPTWTWRPEAVSKVLIWRTMKRRPGSVFSQSRKAPISSTMASRPMPAHLATVDGRMAAADDDDRRRRAAALAIRRPARSRRRREISDSPWRRSIGVATSSRIGPKLV